MVNKHTHGIYLELSLESSEARRISRDRSVESVHFDPQITCCHLSLSTHHQFTQGIMDEHILSLHTQREREREREEEER